MISLLFLWKHLEHPLGKTNNFFPPFPFLVFLGVNFLCNLFNKMKLKQIGQIFNKMGEKDWKSTKKVKNKKYYVNKS